MNKRYLPLLAARLLDAPLFAEPRRAEIVQSVLAERLGLEPMVDLAQVAAQPPRAFVDDDEDEGDSLFSRGPLYRVNDDGIALVQVLGETVNRGSWIDALSGLSAYSTISDALVAARDDDKVRGILLEIDSPGGEAAGCMECGALVRQVDAVKPVVAYVDGQACSAGYAIACGAGTIVAAPSATLGSIGVVVLHVDRSAQMEKQGLKPTLIQKGAYKTDGTSVKPLDAGAEARIDALLEVLYGLFVSTVAANRPALTEDAVRATEAGLYIGQQAVAAGLADRVGTFQDALAAFPRAGAGEAQQRGPSMADQTTNAGDGGTAGAPPAPSAADERARIKGITTHAEAKGREDLAAHLAYDTDMGVEAAVAILKASNKKAPAAAEAPAGGAGLVAEMSAMRQPDLGPGGPGGADAGAKDPSEMSPAERERWEYEDGAKTASKYLGRREGEVRPGNWASQFTGVR